MSEVFTEGHYPIDLSSLPVGWTTTYLGNVLASAEPGFASGTHNQLGQGVLHLRPMNIDRLGKLDLRDAKYVDGSSEKRLLLGDVVFNNTNSPVLVGKTAAVKTSLELAFSNHMTRLRPAQGVSADFVAHQLHFLWMSGYFLHRCSHHVNQASISTTTLTETVPLVLPSLREQRRIVVELERQFSRLDAGVASLQRLQANLKRYRAAILKAACNGSLVGSTARPSETGGLWPLPPGWRWARAEEVSEFITKGTTPAAELLHAHSGEVPFIKVYNLTFTGALDFSKEPTFTSRKVHETELKRSIVRPGDVLMNIVGPPLGKVSVVPATYAEWNINQAIARYRPIRGLDPYYLSLVLQNREIIDWAISRSKATAGQFNLTLEIARQLPIPLPPEDQQALIVAEAERRLSISEAVASALSQNLRKTQSLRHAILANAFEGRLVAQDPNDEPASALLERIRQAKALQSPEPRGRKAKPKPEPPEGAPLAPPPVRAAEPAPAGEPVPEPQEAQFLELDREEQLDILWQALLGQGTLDKDTAIRTAADELRALGLARFQRLRHDGPLYGTLAAGLERGVRDGSFDRPRRGSVRAVLRDPKEYTDEDWRQCLLAVTGDEPAEIEPALRAAAEWAREAMGLEFARLREDGVILTGLREALEAEVRVGRIVRRGGRVWRG